MLFVCGFPGKQKGGFPAMARIDYHLHTYLCKHAVGQMEEYVDHALASGLEEIGFSDHNPLPGGFDSQHRMEERQIEAYLTMVQRMRECYPRMPIKTGFEVDFLPGAEEFLRIQLERYPFDYVYGSVHYLGDWNFDNPVFVHRWDTQDVDDLYARYFDCLDRMIHTRLFDIVAHADLIKKFGHRPAALDLDAIYERLCASLRATGMCLEINTAGLRKEVGEIYPERRMLEIACRYAVPIVFGSDAHRPDEVGYAFDYAAKLARSVGYTHSQRFSQRKREAVEL